MAIKQFEAKLEDKVISSNNLGSFYKYVNSKLKNSSGIDVLMGPDGQPAMTS
jgi:hypothetical protein